MALPKAREIMEQLQQMHKDPREIRIIVGIAERLNVQHQQMMAVVTEFGKMQDLLITLIGKMGIRDDNLKRLGVEEMMKGSMSSAVNAVDAQDDDPDDTQAQLRLPNT